MKEQLSDKQFERLAKLVGGALAKRWAEIMAKRHERPEPIEPRTGRADQKSRKSEDRDADGA